MEKSFWHQRWEKNEIGFHAPEANPGLVRYFKELSLPENSRVFIPLCGKTLDIGWLLSKGHRVAGAELSRIAIEQLFQELGVVPRITKAGPLEHFRAENLDIFVGDLFELEKGLLGPVDAVYDRAALVALPPEMRVRYTKHLMAITDKAPQLLICYEYDQSLAPGPPFSVPPEEVQRHYQGPYRTALLANDPVPGGLRGKVEAKESVWSLKRA